MRQAVLLGNPKTKRTLHLKKAMRDQGAPIEFWDWETFWREKSLPKGWEQKELVLKIDPPVWTSCCLEELGGLTSNYETFLEQLEILGEREHIRFLNSPQAILQLLDKKGCKKVLKNREIPVTETLEGDISDGEHLLMAMAHYGMFQVFIKPVKGSGAAGIAAFRYQKRTGNMTLYTCGMEDPQTGRLVNTKRLRRFTDREQVMTFLNRLLSLDCIVERWYAKAQHQGFSYDLRAVVQDGQTDFMLARLSKGPVTNLHLNNHPLKASELGLTVSTVEEIEELCKRAAGSFQGLRSVGIDILLEKGSFKPRVIEMNGQGDLIYQDIYDKNSIYQHQAKMIKRWLCGRQ